jgi:hypothetical protein
MTKIERTYYPNGGIETEVSLVGDVPHGVTRHWHVNGVLEKEIPYTYGIIDGVVRQWNDKGELLCTSELKKGTGVYGLWLQNGTLYAEMPYINGKVTGRQRVYCGEELLAESYWLENEEVSKKRYLAACQKNPDLPRYDDSERPVKLPKLKRKSPKRDDAQFAVEVDELCTSLLRGAHVREALSWLTEVRQPSRSLGEMKGQNASLHLVKKLYALGAVAVHAVEIDEGADEDQNTGKLVVELPHSPEIRMGLLKFCGRLAKKQGFDPDPNVGQRYALLILD